MIRTHGAFLGDDTLAVTTATARRSTAFAGETDEIRRGLPLRRSERAARRLLEHVQACEPVQEGRIYIEKLKGPFLFGDRGSLPNTVRASRLRLKVAGR